MEAVKIYSGSAATTGAKTTIFLPTLLSNFGNQNNTGQVQMAITSGAGSPTLTIEGSANGTHWISVTTGVNSTTGFHIALFPYMRVNITTAGAATDIDVFVVI
jgi:hypothetical protein